MAADVVCVPASGWSEMQNGGAHTVAASGELANFRPFWSELQPETDAQAAATESEMA
jgi:hypothetical protein